MNSSTYAQISPIVANLYRLNIIKNKKIKKEEIETLQFPTILNSYHPLPLSVNYMNQWEIKW